jgi:hypothetical protein
MKILNRQTITAALVAAPLVTAGAILAASGFNQVNPFIFDPGKSFLVQGTWLNGIGCPTGQVASQVYLPPDFSTLGPQTITDPACPSGDAKDKRVQGLLLVKTGPTGNNASAGATLKNVKGITLTELGYDIRKPGLNQNDPRGSHCGAGSPRFNVTTSDGFWFIGCNSPTPVSTGGGLTNGWLRLRWSGIGLMGYKDNVLSPITGTVKSISIVFDEGQDTGPDNFGAAMLDNIDVNGTLVGRGSESEHRDSHAKDGHDDNND